MTEHTPGPWRVDPSFNKDVQTACGSLEIASTSDATLHEGEKPPRAEQLANAHLIAAAPDLLEALSAMLDVADNGDPPDYHLANQARSAIAKAKGQTP